MKRYIEVKCIGNKTYKIIKQTHKNLAFTPEGDTFFSSNRVQLSSSGGPAWYGSSKIYMRGNEPSANTWEIRLDASIEEKFLFAIKEYNKMYSGIPCKCNRAIVCKKCMENLGEVLNF